MIWKSFSKTVLQIVLMKKRSDELMSRFKKRDTHIDEADFYDYFNEETKRKIKQRDSETIRKTFEKYQEVFETIVLHFLNIKGATERYRDFTFLDCIGQIYLDMPHYRYDSPSYMITCCKMYLSHIWLGGYDYIVTENSKLANSTYRAEVISLDFENSEDGSTFDYLEHYITGTSLEDEFFSKFETSNFGKIFNFCKSVLNDKELECFRLALCGYSSWQIKKFFNITGLDRARKRILSHYPELKILLQEANLYSPVYDEIYLQYLEKNSHKKSGRKTKCSTAAS